MVRKIEAMKFVGVVKELWRYPVKSMIGEPANISSLMDVASSAIDYSPSGTGRGNSEAAKTLEDLRRLMDCSNFGLLMKAAFRSSLSLMGNLFAAMILLFTRS